MEHDAGDPIEIDDSDDEGDVESGQIEEDGIGNRDGEYDELTGVHSGNGIGVNVQHEVKVKDEIQIGMQNLPLVEFDPIKANNKTASTQMNTAATAALNNQGQSSSSPNVQEQLKHDAVECFKCTSCAKAITSQKDLN